MAGKRLALSALVGAAALLAWSGLAWAAIPNYTNFPTSGGTSQPESVGHSGGANDDLLPPMNVTNDRPAPGSPETVSDSTTACAPFSSLTVQLTFVAPGSTPVDFGSGNVQTGPSGSISVAGTIPANAASGIWSIFATCKDSGGTTLVYTVTVVVGGGTGGAVRSSVASSAAPRSPTSASSSAGGAPAPGTSGANTTVWTPPATWATPALRALVVPAVNAAAASAPVVLSLGSHPVVAHAPISPVSDAPWRDAVMGLAGLVAVLGLSRVSLRPGHRRRHRRQKSNWKRRHSPLRGRFGGNSKGMW